MSEFIKMCESCGKGRIEYMESLLMKPCEHCGFDPKASGMSQERTEPKAKHYRSLREMAPEFERLKTHVEDWKHEYTRMLESAVSEHKETKDEVERLRELLRDAAEDYRAWGNVGRANTIDAALKGAE